MAYTYDEISLGDTYTFSKQVSEADVVAFANITGDDNPLHLDEAYARTTRFGQRIAHGALTAGIVSAALTAMLGSSLYISQHSEFMAPVHLGDTVRAIVSCTEKMERRRVRIRTLCYKQDDTLVLQGEAILQLKKSEV